MKKNNKIKEWWQEWMAIKWKLSPKQRIKHFSTGVETATKHHHLSKSPPPMVASPFAQVQYYPTEKEERKRKKHHTTDWLVVTNSETSCRSWGWKLAEIWQKKTFAFVTMRLNNYDAVKRRVGDWQRYENTFSCSKNKQYHCADVIGRCTDRSAWG